MSTAPLGVYVHIPFCAKRCDYCAFVTTVGNDHLHQRYVASLTAELELRRPAELRRRVTSVFFGGGTPSRLEPSLIAALIERIDRAPGCEVTLEINPEDVSDERLEGYVEAGVTRMSVGMQSTAPHVLADLGREHRGGDARQIARAIARSGVSTWSMDLIVGSVAETDEDLRRSVGDVLDHDDAPPHVSAYLLSVERGTPLSRDVSRHPDDDVLAHRYELLDALLVDRGYKWYEISNWARPGHECTHNRLYWDQGDYVGIGVGAHSHHQGRRAWNVGNLMTYLETIEAGTIPVLGSESLEPEAVAFEALSLKLRTSDGVPVTAISGGEDLDEFLERRGDHLVLTRAGRRMADAVALRLVPPAPTRPEDTGEPGSFGPYE